MALCAAVNTAHAGGLMTNTNYHIAFDRMMARGATFDIDAAYSNPAGTVWGHEGWQLSLNFQKPWQNRDIKLTTTALEKTFEGKASAPIVPALFATYKKDRWAISSMIGIVGSGGFVKYADGVPQYNLMVTNALTKLNQLPGVNTPEGSYTLNSEMKGKQYIYGGQVNFSYKILDCLSAAVGFRANYYDGYYRGHVIAGGHATYGDAATMLIDVDQKGWGFTQIVAADFHMGAFTFAARYEFRTKVNPRNDTNILFADLGSALKAKVAAIPGYGPAALKEMGTALTAAKAPFEDGVRTRYDMPALLAVAAGYEFTPKLRATLEYHFFDDKNAKMANDRQKELTHGTHELLAGVEWDINEKFTVSCGGQRTDYGLSDGYEQNTSFACDSWSIGFGGAWNINQQIRLNAGYFCSLYSDYKKATTYGTETYSRTNHVIGLGIDYRF